MSLLDRGNQDVLIFMEIEDEDRLGNIRTKPGDVGIPARVRLQVQGQSGTSSRRQEQDNEGYETEKVYKMGLPRNWPHGVIGAQAQVEWNEERWAVFGDVNRYNGSPRTAHVDYTIKRF